jgi:DNA-binding transcriptional LysR family regulator
VVMGPVALVADELRAGRLLTPLQEPALRTRGYFVYARATNIEVSAIAVFRKWLMSAGSTAETEYPHYLSSNRS